MIISNIKKIVRKTLFRSGLYFIPDYKKTDKTKIGLSTVFYHDGVDISIYSISSFFYQTGLKLPIFGINDGSLTISDIKKLKKHFRVTLVSPKQVEKEVSHVFKQYPNIRNYFLSAYSPYTKYKLASVFLSPKNRLIYFDGDILLHDTPDEIIGWVHNKSSTFWCLEHARKFFGSDKRVDLDYSFRSLLQKFKYKLISTTFNSGILCIPDKRLFNFRKIDKVFSLFNSTAYSNTIYAEESSMGIALNDLKGKILPSKKYVCPVTSAEYKKATSGKIVALHYIGESKNYFERDTVLMLVRSKLFRS